MFEERAKYRMRYVFCLVIMSIILLSNVSFSVTPCHAAIVFADDFNDGNYDGWIVPFGNWTFVDNALLVRYSKDTFRNGGLIYHASTIAYGTWSYDMYNVPGKLHEMFPIIEEFTPDESYDYHLITKLTTTNPEILFGKDIGKNFGLRIAVWVSDSDIDGSWHHMDITRETNGRFRIYLNRMLIIDAVDSTFTTSKYVGFLCDPDGPKIDNIVVSDAIDIHPSAITCTVSSASLAVGDAVTISGSITSDTDSLPLPQIGMPVTLSYQTNGTWVPLATVTSTTDGHYTHTWTPPIAGAYQLRASWTGDNAFGGALSSEVPLTVSKTSTTISCAVSSSDVTEGNSATISGAITPLIAETMVTLTYQKPDGSTVTRTVPSDVDGEYSDSYTPDTEGAWSVTVSWDGDGSYEGTTSSTTSFTVTKSGCLIATATYGSELTPQVQFLRDFREKRVLQTFAGHQFMTVFNSFYYSWSPNIADTIRSYDSVATVMKPILYPLIGILQVSEGIFSVLSFNPELAVVATGCIASALITGIYLLPLTLLISYFRKRAVSRALVSGVGIIWLASLCAIVLAELTQSSALMMTATGSFVLATMGATVLSMMNVLLAFLKKRLQS